MSFDSEVTPGAVSQLRQLWENKTHADRPLPAWQNAALGNWIGNFGFAAVADAIQTVTAPRFSEGGERIIPDINDVPRFAAVEQAEAREPGMKVCYLIRGLMREKFYFQEEENEALLLLRQAMRAGVSVSVMHEALENNDTIEDFFLAIGIERHEFRIAMGQPVVDLKRKEEIFISMEDPEWPAWDAYWRKTKGVGAPLNKNFGWFFDSLNPPDNQQKKRNPKN